jgi:hypothetical protein
VVDWVKVLQGKHPYLKSKEAIGLSHPGAFPGSKFPARFVSQVWEAAFKSLLVQYLFGCLFPPLPHSPSTTGHCVGRASVLPLCSLCLLYHGTQVRFSNNRRMHKCGIQFD